jgi:hypothetical protein
MGKKGYDEDLSSGKKGYYNTATKEEEVEEDVEIVNVEEDKEDDLDIVYVSESDQSVGNTGLTKGALAGTIFAVLLTVLLCVNITFLCLFWKSRRGEGTEKSGDPYGTTVTVDDLKGGKVLVKKVIPGSNGGEDVVQKTVYPDRKTAAGHGFFASV